MASRRVRGAEASESGYIQGAADDHEAWSHGLTPTVFWKNKDVLMKTSEEDAPALIERLLNEDGGSSAVASLIKPTSRLYISPSDQMKLDGFDVVISCTPEPFATSMLKDAGVKNYLHLKCQTGKLGSRDLRTQLPRILYFFSSLSGPITGRFLVCCPTGKDLSVGTALAILCLYTNEKGAIDTSTPKETNAMGKAFIKQRLSWITTSNPALNPSRSTLQSVNAILLESQDPKASLQTKSNGTDTGITTSIPIRETRPLPHEPRTDNSSETEKQKPSSPSLPTSIFENLRNSPDKPWNFTRQLRSTLPTHPSGTVSGTATFTSCDLPAPFPPTLLYAEEGEFATDTGLKFNARRKYVYQLETPTPESTGEKAGDYIAVRFFDDEKMPRADIKDGVGKNGEGVGGSFVDMGNLEASGKEVKAKNKETHLCAEDLYTASWTFGSGVVNGDTDNMWWEVRYDVKGPKKDYVSTTRYTLI
ncbi:uncharacterized protein J4E92_002996 [Alternaria infectoria]|uniref:uncharacterized protein n=1 Tax=Alternaria infectoria TaxID=45303 RepID=UPI00221E9B66|nr:uncharacterized protein J4E92_002996 [Alternaria infectoria]KAI4935705.1 hypothetical protein J4E92_002996 [Alternaria infectoria]